MATDKQAFKTVATYADRTRAEIVAAMLRDNGIPAGVFGADSSYPSLGYAKAIEVKVNEDDYETALALVNSAGE
ncbi:MAG: DUF2007 domain-containing protein [Bacteroidales bacterium]|nr:DUF2007 domain-containing protein [Bacteroidales bacterium]